MRYQKNNSYSRGFITILSVLIVSAIGISVAISALLLGLDNARNGYTVMRSAQARALANACAEEALLQFSQSLSFNNSGNISLAGGTCNFNVGRGPKQTAIITSYGTAGTIIRKVSVTVSVQKKSFSLASWQEVADF